MISIIFLGTNGWYDTPTGNTLCVLVKTGEADIFLDCGSGFFKAERYISGEKPAYIILSHLHYDHISGFHGLCKINFSHGLKIIGQKGTADVLRRYIYSPFTFPVEKLHYPTEFIDLDGKEPVFPFDLTYLQLVHSDKCLGYRITAANRTISFCTDTGFCDNAVKLSQDCDILIAECAHVSGEDNSDWPHLNPESAARIAHISHAKKLVLTHFDASRYDILEKRKDAEAAARKIFSESYASYDLMEMNL